MKKRGRNASRDDGAGGRIAAASDAWSAWGILCAGATSAARTMAMDCRPALSGFSLGRRRVDNCASVWADNLKSMVGQPAYFIIVVMIDVDVVCVKTKNA